MFCKVCIRLTHPPLIPFSPKSTVNFVLNRIQIYIVYIITMISVVADLSEYNKDTRIINFIEAHSMAYGSLHQQEMENTLEALDDEGEDRGCSAYDCFIELWEEHDHFDKGKHEPILYIKRKLNERGSPISTLSVTYIYNFIKQDLLNVKSNKRVNALGSLM